MTEVASLLHPSDHRLTTVRHYEAGPPPELQVVDTGPDSYATTKEEEWVTTKKTEVLNTKQIETRVKRQVVLEDGKVVEDSGPQVTTNTTEDTETKEHNQTEHRKLGDGDQTGNPDHPLHALEHQGESRDAPDGVLVGADGSRWVATANPDGIVREVKERRVLSREETEEVKETEDVQHYGDITDQQFVSALKVATTNTDIRPLLRSKQADTTIVSTGPRLIRDTSKSQKVTDTEETRELSSIRPDGKIVTETERTTQHEEVKDDELPEEEADQFRHKETSERYFKARDQQDVDYYADGVKIGHEMRFKAETMEAERRGDGGAEESEWDSLSARARKRQQQKQPHRYRGLESSNPVTTTTPLDRKDALTRKPLDFDFEEETRKVETSKWLENHFGSESRSSKDSLGDEDEDTKPPAKTSFFNVTIKSQASTAANGRAHALNGNVGRMYGTTQLEPEREKDTLLRNGNGSGGYFQGISEWSERNASSQQHRQQQTTQQRMTPSPSPYSPTPQQHSPPRPYGSSNLQRTYSPSQPRSKSPPPQTNGHDFYTASTKQQHVTTNSMGNLMMTGGRPAGGRGHQSPPRYPPPQSDYRVGMAAAERVTTPTPPQRKKAAERRQQRASNESRYDSGYRTPSRNDIRDEPLEEPPPDYSPPSPPPMPQEKKEKYQKTRFADNTNIATNMQGQKKQGNIIGQSIRKLVGKIRSASAERKARQRAKRSPSPTYQAGTAIDRDIGSGHPQMEPRSLPTNQQGQPVQRYYLGEDPFAGSIYGRENKYDGVRPVVSRPSRRQQHVRDRLQDERSQSTLGRITKSSTTAHRENQQQHVTQTLPRQLRHDKPTRLDTINVSIINNVQSNPPTKPIRSYNKPSLARSKSFSAHAVDLLDTRPGMYKSNPQLNRLDEVPAGLKSPGLISSLSRSQRDLRMENEQQANSYSSRYTNRNGVVEDTSGVNKRVFLRDLKSRAPELFKTLHEDDHAQQQTSSYVAYNDPPTRLRDNYRQQFNTSGKMSPSPQDLNSRVIRRGSNSSDNYSETYHTTTRNDDPLRPSVTNTVKTFAKKTLPGRDGRSIETIESTETKSVTKSQYKGASSSPQPGVFSRGYYAEDKLDSGRFAAGGSGASPTVIEVRNYRR